MGLRITKVYTKQGDKGTTRLGGGQEVAKDSIRIQAYGTVDELNSVIGIAISFEPIAEVKATLTKIQHELFTLGGDLCVLEEDKQKWEMQQIEANQVTALEKSMDRLNEELKPLEDFILPGGTKVSAFLHQARCVCRRAETLVVSLSKKEEIGKSALKYLNRLSDTLFVLARFENFKNNMDDVYWQKESK
ncbi:cob(I)yrinic acid a,c-diamide adenosyltransferase [candidate division KSB1 bacterium]|nr:cob(I)yrinic acid a,c-diamide adenosyltransferase [candidate division KSB1 bacterium]MCH7755185.1 cob(I)yrinic acid a,c-diamide adenosyltransferase [candidate division KSB1 bacterium]MCH8957206.1 cob(I)yrinic acid a,c-diamide adenosyltransferase [candidate division KSB1 bacterium]MCH8982162.1 cob(I)yrinic acid a,c-diamide adenosyltransferase [candidate division KSB1 bacterium]